MASVRGYRHLVDFVGMMVLIASGWSIYETNGVPSLQGIPIIGTAIQARCDQDFVRVRSLAGTKDLMGASVPVVTTVAGGEALSLTGRSVRLGDQPGRWLSVSVGGRSGWVRDDVVEPIRACDPPKMPGSSAS